MTGDVMDLLQYTFFQHALLGSLLASIACGIIGTYIVTRRLVFISGGITHASFGGIGLGLFAGISPILSAGQPYSRYYLLLASNGLADGKICAKILPLQYSGR
jgi:ABC-type Mn2+/Zn2+ transport system permease subunit